MPYFIFLSFGMEGWSVFLSLDLFVINSVKSIRDPMGQIHEQKNLPNIKVRIIVMIEINRPGMNIPDTPMAIIAAKGSIKKNSS